MQNELRTLATFNQTFQAYIFEALLEERGIESFISEETIFGQIDGIKVMVDESNYETAMELYRQFEIDNQIGK